MIENTEKDLTEGEQIIEQYLKDEFLDFDSQKRIDGLKGDVCGHRDADFYIKDFDIYIEFLGKWNVSEKHKSDYKQKMAVYRANNIPCVYLWPENLGFLKQALNYRIEKELRNKKKLKHLRRFKSYKMNGKGHQEFTVFIFLSLFMLLWITRDGISGSDDAIREIIELVLMLFWFLLFGSVLLSISISILIQLNLDEKYDGLLKKMLKLKRMVFS